MSQLIILMSWDFKEDEIKLLFVYKKFKKILSSLLLLLLLLLLLINPEFGIYNDQLIRRPLNLPVLRRNNRELEKSLLYLFCTDWPTSFYYLHAVFSFEIKKP